MPSLTASISGKSTKAVIAALAVLVIGAFAAFRAIVDTPSSNAAQDSSQPIVTPVLLLLPRPTPAYPLRISSDRRYLLDQHGTPFLLTGDSPQALDESS